MTTHNRYKGMKGEWLGIAFNRGKLGNINHDIIMSSTWGPWVHCEVIVGKDEVGTAYGAFEHVGGFLRSQNVHDPRDWSVFVTPVSSLMPLQAAVVRMVDLGIKYNTSDLWQCCIKTLLPFETELDCHRPESWKNGVFCSQVALLMLRRMSDENVVSLPTPMTHMLHSVHSRGCSPNTLFNLVRTGMVQLY